jgi:hypothetical protein
VPDVAVMVMVAVPSVAVLLAVKTIEAGLPDCSVPVAGVAVTPLGSPLTVKVMLPVKAF